MAHRIISRAESGLRPALRRSTIATPTPELWLHRRGVRTLTRSLYGNLAGEMARRFPRRSRWERG